MAVILLDGIVTRYTNYRENDRIIDIFTLEKGRIDAKARGCRKPTSPLLPVCQPFVFGQFELYHSKDKYTVNQCEIKESFYPLREDYTRFAYAAAMLQLINSAVQENEPNEALFSLLYHALSFLAYGKCEPKDLFCCFLIRYLDRIGYRPSITSCGRCGRDIRGDGRILFSPKLGGASCVACGAGAVPVGKTSLEAMRRMLLMEDRDMHKVVLNDRLRGEILPALTGYAAYTLDYGMRAIRLLSTELNIESLFPGPTAPSAVGAGEAQGSFAAGKPKGSGPVTLKADAGTDPREHYDHG